MERIVVGVDGSEHGDAALRWAVEEARSHDATLVAVMAWTWLDQPHLTGDEDFDPDYSAHDAEEVLAAVVERIAGSEPDVRIEQRAVMDLPAAALLSEAEDADLLVVGCRGLGGFKGLLLGSVSQQLAHHSPCPLLIHRGAPQEDPETD